MDLDHKDGKLRVHYGDRLVTLMREVRQLSALGFAVPAKIQQTASTANKFYRHGMILKQVKLHLVVHQSIITTNEVILEAYSLSQTSKLTLAQYQSLHFQLSELAVQTN